MESNKSASLVRERSKYGKKQIRGGLEGMGSNKSASLYVKEANRKEANTWRPKESRKRLEQNKEIIVGIGGRVSKKFGEK